jgi:hypothetical protein
MKESWSEILWNEEIRRRCEVVEIAEKVREARLRWFEHVIRRYEGEPGWIKWNEEIRRCEEVVDIAEKMKEAKLRWSDTLLIKRRCGVVDKQR